MMGASFAYSCTIRITCLISAALVLDSDYIETRSSYVNAFRMVNSYVHMVAHQSHVIFNNNKFTFYTFWENMRKSQS